MVLFSVYSLFFAAKKFFFGASLVFIFVFEILWQFMWCSYSSLVIPPQSACKSRFPMPLVSHIWLDLPNFTLRSGRLSVGNLLITLPALGILVFRFVLVKLPKCLPRLLYNSMCVLVLAGVLAPSLRLARGFHSALLRCTETEGDCFTSSWMWLLRGSRLVAGH